MLPLQLYNSIVTSGRLEPRTRMMLARIPCPLGFRFLGLGFRVLGFGFWVKSYTLNFSSRASGLPCSHSQASLNVRVFQV